MELRAGLSGRRRLQPRVGVSAVRVRLLGAGVVFSQSDMQAICNSVLKSFIYNSSGNVVAWTNDIDGQGGEQLCNGQPVVYATQWTYALLGQIDPAVLQGVLDSQNLTTTYMIERTGPGTEACTVFQQDLPVGLGSGGSSSGPTLGSEPPVPEGGGSSDSSGAAGTTAAADSATDDAASATAATAFAAAATMQPSLLAADSLATSPVTLDALAVAMRAMSERPCSGASPAWTAHRVRRRLLPTTRRPARPLRRSPRRPPLPPAPTTARMRTPRPTGWRISILCWSRPEALPSSPVPFLPAM